MSVFEQITNHLSKYNVEFSVINHQPIITSEEAALVRKDFSITLEQGLKSLVLDVVKTDNQQDSIMVVVPGHKRFDKLKIKNFLNLKDISFANVDKLKSLVGGVEPGGVPPFGNLFGLRLISDSSILEMETIAFSAGEKSVTITMKSRDWQKVTNPVLFNIV